jgi:multidrug efflux system outer membrane protein
MFELGAKRRQLRLDSGAQRRRVTALREFARLSKLRWDNGYADYLGVLHAQNELFGAELSAVRSQADALTQVVAAYIAIGGGWLDDAARRVPQPQGAASGALAR